MADTKISALTASTTPLAGTEVLPIVQSGTTKQVSVANLTAGRAISAAEMTLTAGNLIVASGQGIDFSATPGTGTSELLDDYEEGEWTPTVAVNPGTATSYTISKSVYTKVGNQVTAKTEIVPIGGTFGNGIGFSQIDGLPFAASGNFAGSVLNSANFTLGQSALAATSTSTTSLIVMAGLTISTGNTATFQVTYSV
jgi:hypothetical protein